MPLGSGGAGAPMNPAGAKARNRFPHGNHIRAS
jgi:hypothetical protein